MKESEPCTYWLVEGKVEMKSLVEEIIALEWAEFQKVNNEGGRAYCQDDWPGFHIYRKSQFLAWNMQMLESYYADLVDAINDGRNLITEKYARMMESTAPERYLLIKDALPAITGEKQKLIDDIARISLKWAREFAEEYPEIAGSGRPLRAAEDNLYNTSVETYLRGELATYSENTLDLYYKYVTQLSAENKNLTKMIMENTVREYGYSSLDKVKHSSRKS